jgi:hypothetical protein
MASSESTMEVIAVLPRSTRKRENPERLLAGPFLETVADDKPNQSADYPSHNQAGEDVDEIGENGRDGTEQDTRSHTDQKGKYLRTVATLTRWAAGILLGSVAMFEFLGEAVHLRFALQLSVTVREGHRYASWQVRH